MDLDTLLNAAVESHQAGDLDRAATLYSLLLKQRPDHAEAWHLSGVLALQLGRPELAIEQMQLAVGLQPALTEAWANLAAAYLAAEDNASAAASCQQCLQLAPSHARAHMLLGNTRQMEGLPHDALACYREGLQHGDENPLLWCNYGACLLETGQLEPARAALERALSLDGALREAAVNLGATLRRMGDLDGAAAILEATLEKFPHCQETQINWANVLREQQRFEESLRVVRSILDANPEHAKAWNLAGMATQELDSAEAALPLLSRAAELDSQFVSNVLFATSLAHFESPERVFQEHCRWAAHLPTPAAPIPHAIASRDPDRVLRVGFLSGDLRHHAVAAFVLGWIEHLDAEAIEWHGFSESECDDKVTRQFVDLAASWTRTCGMSDATLARQIVEKRIDILIDLAGHTGRNRLAVMNWRPAPIQMTYLGYPNTTGLASVDYFLTDAFRDPAGSETRYCESLIRMEGSSICFQPPAAAAAPTPGEHIPPFVESGSLTLGSMHRFSKLNHEVLAYWAGLLESLPNARLLLVRDSFSLPKIRRLVEHRLATAGVDLERVEFRGDWRQSHLEHYRDMDFLLPVFPWGAGTTTYEALWMGVLPLASKSGPTAGRAVVAAMQHLGLAEWLASSEADAASVCERLAQDTQIATQLRSTMRQRMRDALCNGPMHAKKMEQVLRDVWKRWLAADSGPADAGQVVRQDIGIPSLGFFQPSQAKVDQ